MGKNIFTIIIVIIVSSFGISCSNNNTVTLKNTDAFDAKISEFYKKNKVKKVIATDKDGGFYTLNYNEKGVKETYPCPNCTEKLDDKGRVIETTFDSDRGGIGKYIYNYQDGKLHHRQMFIDDVLFWEDFFTYNNGLLQKHTEHFHELRKVITRVTIPKKRTYQFEYENGLLTKIYKQIEDGFNDVYREFAYDENNFVVTVVKLATFRFSDREDIIKKEQFNLTYEFH